MKKTITSILLFFCLLNIQLYAEISGYLYYKNKAGGNTARVMHDGKWWYKYDANGNRTIKAAAAQHEGNTVTINTTTEYWEYVWDYHNRLVKVQQFNAPDNASNVCVEYTYDALNRRIERKGYRTYYKGDIDDEKEDSPTSTHPSSTSKNPEIKYDGSRSGEKPRTEKKH